MSSEGGVSCVCDSLAVHLHGMLGYMLGQSGKAFGKGDWCFCGTHTHISSGLVSYLQIHKLGKSGAK